MYLPFLVFYFIIYEITVFILLHSVAYESRLPLSLRNASSARNDDTHSCRLLPMPTSKRTHNKFTIKWQNDNSYTQWWALRNALWMRARTSTLCHEKVEWERAKNESRTKWNIIHGIFRTCWSPSLPIAGAAAAAAATDDNNKNDFYEIRCFSCAVGRWVVTVPIAFRANRIEMK